MSEPKCATCRDRKIIATPPDYYDIAMPCPDCQNASRSAPISATTEVEEAKTVIARTLDLDESRSVSCWKYDANSYGFKFRNGENTQYIRLSLEAVQAVARLVFETDESEAA